MTRAEVTAPTRMAYCIALGVPPTIREVAHEAGVSIATVSHALSGKRPVIIDPSTGEIIAVELFIGVLGASSYVYAEACPSQELTAWITAHVRMVEFWM